MVQRRSWVSEYLAIDKFQQLHLGRRLLQLFDDLRLIFDSVKT